VQILQLNPRIPFDKGKYGFRYCNEAPKFQLVEASVGVGIAMKPQIPVGKGKYECSCNETPKFQLVKVSISSGITSLNEKSTLNAIATF
jgi:hypothetical protein